MAKSWKLHQSTFTPAQAALITGVAPGTQRQWWRRGFLGKRSGGAARVTVREIAAMIALRQCSELRLNLDVAASALATLSASALHHIALRTVPWEYVGPQAKEHEFRTWVKKQDIVGDQYILMMLGISRDQIMRFAVLSKDHALLTNDLNEYADRSNTYIFAVIDSWGIALSIIERSQNPLMKVDY